VNGSNNDAAEDSFGKKANIAEMTHQISDEICRDNRRRALKKADYRKRITAPTALWPA